MKRVLITGSRDWRDEDRIARVLDELWDSIGPYRLVHGAARGVDRMAEIHQTALFRLTESHPANWQLHGKRAGYVRNAEMVAAGADLCIAFIRDGSKGATMCADLAEKAGIRTIRYTDTTEKGTKA